MNTERTTTRLTEGKCDLHTHTTASDGMQPPADNVRLAKERGLAAVAITDHDTVAGIGEALQTGKEQGITVVPGVEISTRAGGKDIHVLGYYIDHQDTGLLRRLEELRRTREQRNDRIIAKLQQLGVEVTLQEVIDNLGRPLKPDESVGRPHIADLLVRKGYAEDMRDAFNRYLAEGAAAFISLPRIGPADAFAWITEAGGVSVLAHPGLYGNDELVHSILREGRPAGIEVYHSDHDEAAEQRYLEMAHQYGLLVTGGSDYHGARGGVVFHGELGSRTVEYEVLERLLAARRK
ncbi:PHP domain-containing protein [Paenibacillus sp. JX-17]|uniref:PHP domain-containing protein n=1 Tax=Paenibacillus lacisoli TaxID=3064525 RepID=A0ABT9C8M6_9BACL|nr:PHP domain-containing protein [Paenibacillus sp. JX-17]MDO7905260.1 PHP domain-containing protein [Paenibacillus sp. JX-17]